MDFYNQFIYKCEYYDKNKKLLYPIEKNTPNIWKEVRRYKNNQIVQRISHIEDNNMKNNDNEQFFKKCVAHTNKLNYDDLCADKNYQVENYLNDNVKVKSECKFSNNILQPINNKGIFDAENNYIRDNIYFVIYFLRDGRQIVIECTYDNFNYNVKTNLHI